MVQSHFENIAGNMGLVARLGPGTAGHATEPTTQQRWQQATQQRIEKGQTGEDKMQSPGYSQQDYDADTGQQSQLENGGIALTGRLIAQPHPGHNRDNDGNKR